MIKAYLNKTLYLAIFLSTYLFGQTSYETVADNALNLHPDYSWDAFVQMAENATFFSNSDDNDICEDCSFKTILKMDDAGSNDYVIVLRDVVSTWPLEYGEIQITIFEEDLDKFRKSFAVKHSMKFENDFPVKFYKVRTLGNPEDIKFYKTPNNRGRPIEDLKFNDMFYYAYGKKTFGTSEYVLLATQPYLGDKRDIQDKLMGWVEYLRDGTEINAILWNTNIGMRPILDSKSSLSPIVFNHYEDFKGADGAKLLELAADYGSGVISTIDLKDETVYSPVLEDEISALLVDEDRLQKYHDKYHNEKGRYQRWLPFYFSGSDDDEDKSVMVDVAVLEDMGDLLQEIQQTATAKTVQMAFIVDATMSMSQVWTNLDDILEQMIRNLITEGIRNPEGDIITPKIKVWYYNNIDKTDPHESSGDGSYLLTDEWIETEDDLRTVSSAISGINLRGSDGARAPMMQSIMHALDDPDVNMNPTYFVIIGDAAPQDYIRRRVGDFKGFDDGGLRIIHAIRYKSNAVFAGETNSDYREYVDIYEELKNFNFLNEEHLGDIIPEFDSYTGDVHLNNTEKMRVANKLTDVISEDISYRLNELYSRIQNFKTAGSTNVIEQRTDNPSIFTQKYYDKINKLFTQKYNLKPGQVDGIYFNKGVVVSRDVDGESLLGIDVFIKDELMDGLREYLDQYMDEPDLAASKKLIRRILTLFFEVDYTDTSQDFLESNTFEDLWKKIVGDQKLAGALLPELFDNMDFTFSEIIEALNDKDNIKQFQSNIANCRGQISNQVNEDFAHVILQMKGLQSESIRYWWVPADVFAIFNGIEL